MGGKYKQAVILAAGRGKRLEHETENLPKALVRVGGSSLLELILRNLSSHTALESAVIATGHFHHLVEERIGRTYRGLGIEYVVNEHYDSTNNSYTLWLLREHLAEGFLLVNTDVLFDGRILGRALAMKHESFIVVDVVQPLDEEDMKVRLKNSRIVEISKELDLAASHGEYIGILGFGPDASGELMTELNLAVEVEGKTGIYYEDVVQRMLGRCPVYAVRSDPYAWIEIDTLEDLRRARDKVYPGIADTFEWK